MAEAYVGEIRMFGFGRVPTGWLSCDGSLQSISNFETLYTLIGTTYGGDGQTSFALPDLRGSVPVHEGQGLGLSSYPLGTRLGTESVNLTTQQLPQHNHVFLASNANASSPNPNGNALASVAGNTPPDTWYYPADASPAPTAVTMAGNATNAAGSSVPHDNCMPTLTVQFCICWAGIFPSQN
ncbi:MAG: phage tail protein [Proteobacteria bacterium]|nr:phage tail protein [Pseudomonadota bacterium]